MSTTELFMDPDDVKWFIEENKKDPGYVFGHDGQEKGIVPFITFYIHHVNGENNFISLCDAIIDIAQEFEGLKDEPWKLIYKSSTDVWLRAGDKRLPDYAGLRDMARRTFRGDYKHNQFWCLATDQPNDNTTARWAFCGKVTHNPTLRYTTLKLTFRHRWYQKNKERWHSFIEQCMRRLCPDQCYSGFEVGNGGFGIMSSYEGDVVERISADYFYGLDVDKPSDMGFQYFDNPDGWVNPTDLGAGLRPPTWCFALSPYWLGRLNLNTEKVYAAFGGSTVRITEIPYPVSRMNPRGVPGLWIRMGELSLYPVEDGVPELLVKSNRLIRPVRCNELKLTSLDRWDDDPNPVFDYESSIRWMQRFDPDSNWPSAEVRRPKPITPLKLAPDTGEVPMALPKQPCPKPGVWFAPSLRNKEITMRQGELMPAEETGIGGNAVLWYWLKH